MKVGRLIIPGLVFQAVVTGAGYATGRELVEFFMTGSLAAGLLGMLATAAVWSVTLAIAFEMSRRCQTTDYRSFLRSLIGPFWIAYEFCFAALLILVLSVLAAAAGEVVDHQLGWPGHWGTLAMMAAIAALVFLGTGPVERLLAFWSVGLYILFATVLAICLVRHGELIAARIVDRAPTAGWLQQGISYAGYNLAVVPGILYATRHLRNTPEALIAGGLAGVIAIVPAALFFLAMAAFWPAIAAAPVPIDLVLERLELPWLSAIFYIALFGIFVKTGVALIHAVNERIAVSYDERGQAMPAWLRPTVALSAIAVTVTLAETVGIVALIGRGYEALSAAFLIIFVFPLILIGGWRIVAVRAPGAA